MSKLIVRGGLPGMIRLELEGGEGVDVPSHLTGYQTLHEVMPFLQALADSVPEPVAFAPEKPAPVPGSAWTSQDVIVPRKSTRPPKDAP